MSFKSVLFVCSGNICRSPTAEGLMRHYSQEAGLSDILIESAGTHGLHQGDPPDDRAVRTSLSHGIDIRKQRARKFQAEDFDRFDLIFGMDNGHVQHLRSMALTDEHVNKIHLFLDYTDQESGDVPDPYYGADDGFEQVYNIIENGIKSLVKKTTT